MEALVVDSKDEALDTYHRGTERLFGAGMREGMREGMSSEHKDEHFTALYFSSV